MPVEPIINRRFHDRRITPHEGAELDKRSQPGTVEGDLRKKLILLKVYNLYTEPKIKKIRDEYKKLGKDLSYEEEQEYRQRLFNIIFNKSKQTSIKIRDISLIDPKTKLRLESGFRSNVLNYIADQPEGTLFFIDLNNLKQVNDMGSVHTTGDLYLKTLAESMKELAPEYNLLICRCGTGSDEFMIYFAKELTDAENLEFITKLRKKFKENWAKKRINVSASFGIGFATKSELLEEENIETPEQMYDALKELADRRMYTDKEEVKRKERSKRR